MVSFYDFLGEHQVFSERNLTESTPAPSETDPNKNVYIKIS